jgi:hypothetical protein
MLLSGTLFFLLYFRLTDLYFSNHLTFRAFHCTFLATLSLKNTIYYGNPIIDRNSSIQTLYSYNESAAVTGLFSNDEHFYLKITPLYFITYIFYDLKHSYKRIDLLVHHIISSLWFWANLRDAVGTISFIIFAEGVTFAYVIPTLQNQLIYRLIFSTIIRFPIWLTCLYSLYFYPSANYKLELFNVIVVLLMTFLECVWFNQNYKKLKTIYNNC